MTPFAWCAPLAAASDDVIGAVVREACARLAEWPDDDPDKFDGYHAADVAESVSVDIRARGDALSEPSR